MALPKKTQSTNKPTSKEFLEEFANDTEFARTTVLKKDVRREMQVSANGFLYIGGLIEKALANIGKTR